MATSGNNKFFLGSDTAPHQIKDKESSVDVQAFLTLHIVYQQ